MACSTHTAIPLAPLLLFAGCGLFGGDAAEDNGGGPNFAPVYQTFDSSAPTTSGLAATALRTGDDGSVAVTQATGTIAHTSGALDLDDGTYAFSDANGPSATGLYTDGAGGLILRGNPNLDTSGYEYVTGYRQAYSDGGVTYEADGLMGVATRVTDVPTTGTASYSGAAYATVTTGGQTTTLAQGTSEITANFGIRTVDATLSDFQSVTGPGGTSVAAPLDRIQIPGMAISGNTFSGGAVFTQLGANVVTLTGAPTSTTAGGAFYGYDAADGVPDEVGGVVNITGPFGSLTGGFVAD